MLLLEIPPAFGCSLYFLHIVHENMWALITFSSLYCMCNNAHLISFLLGRLWLSSMSFGKATYWASVTFLSYLQCFVSLIRSRCCLAVFGHHLHRDDLFCLSSPVPVWPSCVSSRKVGSKKPEYCKAHAEEGMTAVVEEYRKPARERDLDRLEGAKRHKRNAAPGEDRVEYGHVVISKDTDKMLL